MVIKICKWRFRNNCCKMQRYYKCKLIIITLTLIVVAIFWCYANDVFHLSMNKSARFAHCQSIDVVYTWVNGSDIEFSEIAQQYDASYDPARFDDKNELRYSLRSLEKHAPWVRHVYIVTNGQIPYWLDLSYEKVSIVPHELLAPAANILPTFSSAAIETFLHRIPQLSERFLYLNDDIFLGSALYPEDLYTESDGVHIYQAWMVPDCATDCPWTYIADGACDAHCNIAACQFDGNDCEHVSTHASIEKVKPILKRRFTRRSFRALLRQQNTTSNKQLQHMAAAYNQQRLSKAATTNSTVNFVTTKAISKKFTNATQQTLIKSSKDIYSQSLIYTNMLLNSYYGFKARNVLAHVGFLMQRSIIDAMHAKFAAEVARTAQHRFRAADDLQFAFAYYTFLMSETRQATVAEIFNEFDTDNSGTWSDREVRTLLARMYPLPLDWSSMRYFEEVMNNCSQQMGKTHNLANVMYSTLVYERYVDSNLPTITKALVEKCYLLADALSSNFGVRQLYKYSIHSKRNSQSNFMMLTSNISDVVDGLDKLRLNPRKFNCINDNLDAAQKEDNALIRQLLEDFYLSFFPQQSKFELQPQFRNRFTNWRDYLRWRRRKRAALATAYTVAIILIAFVLRCFCLHKAKIVRRYVQKL